MQTQIPNLLIYHTLLNKQSMPERSLHGGQQQGRQLPHKVVSVSLKIRIKDSLVKALKPSRLGSINDSWKNIVATSSHVEIHLLRCHIVVPLSSISYHTSHDTILAKLQYINNLNQGYGCFQK